MSSAAAACPIVTPRAIRGARAAAIFVKQCPLCGRVFRHPKLGRVPRLYPLIVIGHINPADRTAARRPRVCDQSYITLQTSIMTCFWWRWAEATNKLSTLRDICRCQSQSAERCENSSFLDRRIRRAAFAPALRGGAGAYASVLDIEQRAVVQLDHLTGHQIDQPGRPDDLEVGAARQNRSAHAGT